ncbi:MAG: hypothetical protein A2747_03815 [Candidatus Yonathbacteria bacterium RIFCSPHIGHO2_01_FULL_44_41]|uniref:Uncharacterized protein n=1 Tax=Candidatus Yonathbacteria bacterium RIFCSPHIGHO2_02_FULL_44_14 TaxID=1802724 RepID=A0A1G2S7T4_9BACT|nr:MAG: hypothetical protein A2747_03815 [Candidatus Yonathbacteria bacterium RIFCSPHIGHO2_01_FULL_44_41]OHA81047.1 MAG: hypothetical protein A3D51_01705 [Candidatus Yonathbacteria bacterium RIFCSPHIGHO2_02_FULL_44_14]OHA81270.1 MAG: hypothetical protein A3B06_03415 [Candidatus Yonathbacteria bacterium RIFCSPLOWO2_01_FULL_43_20]
MQESFPNPIEERERVRLEYVALAIELSESNEIFPFPGIDPEGYSKVKAVEEEYPGYGTPIDELIGRFKNEGIKVVMSDDPKKSGTVYILPALSSDIENDNVFPRQLQIVETVDERLKKLILIGRSRV